MTLFIREAHHLVLERRTIARPASGNSSGVDGRAMDVIADNGVARCGRPGDMAGDLRRDDGLCQRGERLRGVVAGLGFERGEIDRSSIEPRRRPGLKSPKLQIESAERGGQRVGGRVANATRRQAPFANMDDPAQEGAGGYDKSPTADRLLKHRRRCQ